MRARLLFTAVGVRRLSSSILLCLEKLTNARLSSLYRPSSSPLLTGHSSSTLPPALNSSRHSPLPQWIDTHVSGPFKRQGNELNCVRPRRGEPIRFYKDVPEILHRIEAEGSYIAACSRTSAVD